MVSYLPRLWCLAQFAKCPGRFSPADKSPKFLYVAQVGGRAGDTFLPPPSSCLSIFRIGNALTEPRSNKGRRSENEIPNGNESFMPENREISSTPLQLKEAVSALEPVSSAQSGWALRFVPQLTRASLKHDLLFWAGANMRGRWAGLF